MEKQIFQMTFDSNKHQNSASVGPDESEEPQDGSVFTEDAADTPPLSALSWWWGGGGGGGWEN